MTKTDEKEKVTAATLVCPVPRGTDPAEMIVAVRDTAQDGVRVQVLPRPSAVETILDETFGRFGWCCRRYSCGGTLYCSVGIWNPETMEWVHKDAPAQDEYTYAERPRNEAASSLYHAAMHWGVGVDLRTVPVIKLSPSQARVAAVTSPDGKKVVRWRLDQRITVDKVMRTEHGSITAVQFDVEGKKVLWPDQ